MLVQIFVFADHGLGGWGGGEERRGEVGFLADSVLKVVGLHAFVHPACLDAPHFIPQEPPACNLMLRW